MYKFEEKDKDALLKIKNASTRFAKVFKLSDGLKKCDQEKGGCGHLQPKV